MIALGSCFVLLCVFTLASSLSAQQLPSCEDQLAEVHATLSYVRAARQTTEETAGRVTATLQKRLDTSLKELDKRSHPEPAAPATQESPAPETLQKDQSS